MRSNVVPPNDIDNFSGKIEITVPGKVEITTPG
jgi:hypothetical protein